MTLRLEFLNGPEDGRELEFAGEQATVGRSSANDVCIDYDRYVSRHHARIGCDEAQCWIQDLGSRNGTYVDELPVTGRVVIADHAIVRVGHTLIRIFVGENAAR